MVVKEDQDFSHSLIEAFSSLKLTIALLLILAVSSIIGTIIPQNAPVEEYLKSYGASTYQVLKILGFLDMYHAGWFDFLLVLLGLNLMACSGKRFRKTWKFFRRPAEQPAAEEWAAMPYKKTFSFSGSPSAALAACRDSLSRAFHSPKILDERQKTLLFAEKGKFSRLGVYFIHLSILVILAGGLIGSLFGYHGEMVLVVGEEADRVVLPDQGQMPLGFRVRLDDFRVSFYPSGTPKEFKSTLTLLNENQKILTQSVRVNHPLRFRGISFYQATYGVADLKKVILGVKDPYAGEEKRIEARLGEKTAIPGTSAQFTLSRFEPNLMGMGPALKILLSQPGQAPRNFWILQNHPQMQDSSQEDYSLSIKEIEPHYYSGLQVTRDPGVWVVWTGCLLMVFGFYVTFLMVHRRVWMRLSPAEAETQVEMAADSQRDRALFAQQWEHIVQKLEQTATEKGYLKG